MTAPEPTPFTPEGPQPLIRETADAAPYPVHALGPLRGPTEAIAKVTEAPPAMCAASVLAASALAVQGLHDVETLGGPRPVSLFLLTVAESGERKSTADKLAMQGVRAFEAKLRPEYDEALESYHREHAIWEKRKAAILRGAGENQAATRADLCDLGPEPEPPLHPSIVTGSATVEGIVKHLPVLRASLGIMTDEGGLMLGGHGMKSENRLNTLATFTAMWDGSTLDRWRAGDGIASYAGRRFSSHLMIQPSAAEEFLGDPLANGQGLLARFLTCRPVSHIGHRLRLTQDADAMAEVDRFAKRIEGLLSHPMAFAEGRRNELAPPVLTLAEDARGVLTDFSREMEQAQAQGETFEDVRAFASKTAEHAARLSAVFTLICEETTATVTGETMADAVELARFYANEAARLQNAAVIPPHIADAELMKRWLLTSWAEEFVTAGLAAQRGPNSLRTAEKCRKVFALLESHGWLVRADGATVDGKQRKEAWRVVRS
ncbi:YfjI family protein [Ruegeria atlantica]|uniref:DUF3987 domain-containing protein n=1 Tax=Ruegeria atlantica TaxID=81569 RepID=A0A0P1EUW0_9RHOB|nr:YfjI family protein [Ruegeria atlantica]CUH45862.1 hypothetical protein RUA4292_00025 [Ruegeria atlantica]